VEDAAQAHGAQLDGRPAGAFGAAAAFSFYPTKNMATIEGGMAVAPDPAIARKLRLLRNQGMGETPCSTALRIPTRSGFDGIGDADVAGGFRFGEG
jgi:dTDP-4-amino-4,6-dideoxygalactose transaminase